MISEMFIVHTEEQNFFKLLFLCLEGAGRDICCVISSLVQLLIDPHFRLITGFQTLLQKEWIAAGHPFCDRLGHLKNDGSEKVNFNV